MKDFFAKYTNLLGTVTAVLAVVLGFMTQVMGCAAVDGTMQATCTASWIPASWVAIVSGAFGVLSLLAKSARPGGFIHSWFGPTAVVVKPASSHAGAGTVSPAEVAKPE